MRLLMLNNEFPPLGGGTGTANHALLQYFARVPWLEIDLITSALGSKEEYECISERIRIFKLPVKNKNIHHSSNRELLTYTIRALPFALKKHRTQIYHLCFAWSALPAGFVALALHRLANLEYIVRICGPDIPGFEQRYKFIYPVLSPFIRAVWRGADFVVAKSDGEANMIRAIDPRINMALVSNGVDLDAFEPGAPVPDDGPLRLICVGRLIKRKGQRHVIDAVKQLSDTGTNIVLDLVGTGDAHRELETYVKDLGLQERVIFWGYVPREEVPKRYAKAHVFVLASYNEGMSIATLEAMAAGLPVVVTRTAGVPELVEDGVNGLTFKWGDIDSLANHLRRLDADRALARSMGIASRARAAKFSWSTASTRYLEIFGELVPSPS